MSIQWAILQAVDSLKTYHACCQKDLVQKLTWFMAKSSSIQYAERKRRTYRIKICIVYSIWELALLLLFLKNKRDAAIEIAAEHGEKAFIIGRVVDR